ncbi:MAG: RluA family pseudouridine synthase, partial [Phycisphaerales bacterium]|nr:RluA family pseudouridine synthase [Phycisphaerales bacterium]
PPPTSDLPAEEIPLEIIHEDDHLIVINKQDDIIVHPARGHQSGTIINGLAWHFQNVSGGGLSDVGRNNARPGVVHRLDRHTSGVMVAAKDDTTHWKLGKQFEDRKTRKRYLALVHGTVEPAADVIDLPLGMHPTQRQRYAVRHDEAAKDSVTIYRVRERYEGFTLVELELRTGRTHQIRVHLSHLGWSIAGDDWYGGKHLVLGDVVMSSAKLDMPRSTPLLTRQALHATLLGFEHPATGAQVEFIAPLPEDLRRTIELLRAHRFIDAPSVAGAELDLQSVL